jgi:spore maturation protein CgeB
MWRWFTDPLLDLGHVVEHFDHFEAKARYGSAGCGEKFVQRLRTGGYDVVLYQTPGQDQMPREAIREGSRHTVLVAWNSDDDWQWEHTICMAPLFTFMVTTYPEVYSSNKGAHPNLLVSQWGCYDRLANFDCSKNYAFTFVGRLYGTRVKQCRLLSQKAGLKVYGAGARLLRLGLPEFRGASRIPWLSGQPLTFEQVHDIWNRSMISFTPMEASRPSMSLQLKGRAFEMGLSGTLMLTNHNPALEEFYEPYKEFVPFYDLNDCAEKARYYVAHEAERYRIAKAYHERTRAEHLWQHRFQQLFRQIGL